MKFFPWVGEELHEHGVFFFPVRTFLLYEPASYLQGHARTPDPPASTFEMLGLQVYALI